ncbi:MAG TPA: hypothetical protein VGL92_19230 [Acidimicrobiia bacterium]
MAGVIAAGAAAGAVDVEVGEGGAVVVVGAAVVAVTGGAVVVVAGTVVVVVGGDQVVVVVGGSVVVGPPEGSRTSTTASIPLARWNPQ